MLVLLALKNPALSGEERQDSRKCRKKKTINIYKVNNILIYKVKGKAVPLRTWSGPEGSRKLRFPGFVTMAQDGGKVVSLTHRPTLPPGNAPGTHFC